MYESTRISVGLSYNFGGGGWVCGATTRTEPGPRMNLGVEKKSTIDFYVVCESVLPHIKRMKIDNGIEHTLTN